MAKRKGQGLFQRIRGNVEWDAIKSAWRFGSPVILPSFVLLYEKVRHLDRDWLLIGGMFALGTATSALGYFFSLRKNQRTPTSPGVELEQSALAGSPKLASSKEATPSALNAEAYRVVIAPKLPFSEETRNLFKAMGRAEEFKIDVDLLVEIYVVNTSSERQYIREIVGAIEIDGRDIKLNTQIGFYAYDLNGESFEWCLDPTPQGSESFHDRQRRLESLSPLATTYPTELAPKMPIEGWVRFLAQEIDPDNLEGKAVYKISVRDSLGTHHPVIFSKRDNRGEISMRRITKNGPA